MKVEMLTPICEKALIELIKETCLILRQDPSMVVRNEALKVYREIADAVIRFQALEDVEPRTKGGSDGVN